MSFCACTLTIARVHEAPSFVHLGALNSSVGMTLDFFMISADFIMHSELSK